MTARERYEDAVKRQLDLICGSKPFAKAKKQQELLQYLVGQVLQGAGDELNEYIIAWEFFGKPASWKPKQDKARPGSKDDPIVRVSISHLRDRLRDYYALYGASDPIVITIGKDSYAPSITHRTTRLSSHLPEATDLDAIVSRIQMAVDTRTIRGDILAVEYLGMYFHRLREHPRIVAIMALTYVMVLAVPRTGVLSAAIGNILQQFRGAAQRRNRPWQIVFTEACQAAAKHHDWKESARLFTLAERKSRQQSMFFWWHTALLASQRKFRQAIEIASVLIDSGLARTNLVARTDLAMLYTLAGRYEEAEELLTATFDFTDSADPGVFMHLLLLYEAQEHMSKLAEALTAAPFPFEKEIYLRSTHLYGGVYAFAHGRYLLHQRQASAEDERFKLSSEFMTVMQELVGNRFSESASCASISRALYAIGIGDYDKASEWLRKAAVEEQEPLSMWFHIFPPFRHLRHHAGYRKLLADLKLKLPR